MGGDWARAREADRAARVPQGPRPRQHGVRGVLRRGMSGRRVRGVLAKAGRPHRAVQEREGREGAGAKWRRAPDGTGRNSATLRGPTSRKTSGAPAVLAAKRVLVRFASPSGSKLSFGAVLKVPLAAKRVSVQ